MWDEIRDDFVETNSTCAACGSKEKLQVHHIVPFHVDEKLELEKSNLITLCMGDFECHLRIGHGGSFSNHNPQVKIDAEKFKISNENDRKKLIREIKKRRK